MPRPHRRHRFALAVWLTALVLALAAPALAQQGEDKEAADFTVGGPITAVDAAKNMITIGGDTGGTFEVDPKATILSGARKLKLGDLKPGWVVEGNGDLRGATRPKKVITYLEAVDTP